MTKYVRYKIEVNLARKNASEPVWHYLMEDEHTSYEFETESEAREVISETGLVGDEIRLIGFTVNGIGRPI